MEDPNWKSNYTTSEALNARHHAWARHAWTSGPFGADLVPQELDKSDKILDAGCGTGVHLQRLSERFPTAHLYAADLSSAMVLAVREACPGVDARRADLESLPWASDTFTGVLCLHVLYHVTDIPTVLGEFSRVLKPGGWAIVSTVSAGAGQEIVNLHNEACRKAGMSQWRVASIPSARFNTRNGGRYLRRVFTRVTYYPRRARLVFSDCEPAIDYYSSMEYYKAVERTAPAEAQRIQSILRLAIEKHISRDGSFTISKNCGTWLGYL